MNEDAFIFKDNLRTIQYFLITKGFTFSYSSILEKMDSDMNLKRLQRICSPTYSVKISDEEVKDIIQAINTCLEEIIEHKRYLSDSYKLDADKMLTENYYDEYIHNFKVDYKGNRSLSDIEHEKLILNSSLDIFSDIDYHKQAKAYDVCMSYKNKDKSDGKFDEEIKGLF